MGSEDLTKTKIVVVQTLSEKVGRWALYLQFKSCCVKLIHPAHTCAVCGRESNEGIFCSQGVKENWEGEGISEETRQM